ncbi:MAG: transposase [Chitinivibrionales bacterium]|nr:transposase [Chitinivibrionales bacterium]
MPRAKRIYLPSHVWHLTHRCHDRDFLLRHKGDRTFWLGKLKESVVKFGLSVLNYMATMNHVHLVVLDRDTSPKTKTIARSMHMIAGETAQQYNVRKGRRGAFWDDRYHGTLVEAESHLFNCLSYIDLNMFRAGHGEAVHEWYWCGLYELLQQRTRRGIIDRHALCRLTGVATIEEHIELRMKAVTRAIKEGRTARESIWTESVAVGQRTFVESVERALQYRCPGRKVTGVEGDGVTGRGSGMYVLREPRLSYDGIGSTAENVLDNRYPWEMDTSGAD